MESKNIIVLTLPVVYILDEDYFWGTGNKNNFSSWLMRNDNQGQVLI